MVWLVIIRIDGTSFPSPSGGFCVTGDSGMTAIVQEKLKCSRRESKRPARRKGEVMGGSERERREKEREKRQSRGSSFEVAAGSFTFRNEIGVPLALRSTLPVPLSPGFIPLQDWYRMPAYSIGQPRLLFLESRGPPFRHLPWIHMRTCTISHPLISTDDLRPLV